MQVHPVAKYNSHKPPLEKMVHADSWIIFVFKINDMIWDMGYAIMQTRLKSTPHNYTARKKTKAIKKPTSKQLFCSEARLCADLFSPKNNTLNTFIFLFLSTEIYVIQNLLTVVLWRGCLPIVICADAGLLHNRLRLFLETIILLEIFSLVRSQRNLT